MRKLVAACPTRKRHSMQHHTLRSIILYAASFPQLFAAATTITASQRQTLYQAPTHRATPLQRKAMPAAPHSPISRKAALFITIHLNRFVTGTSGCEIQQPRKVRLTLNDPDVVGETFTDFL